MIMIKNMCTVDIAMAMELLVRTKVVSNLLQPYFQNDRVRI